MITRADSELRDGSTTGRIDPELSPDDALKPAEKKKEKANIGTPHAWDWDLDDPRSKTADVGRRVQHDRRDGHS